jgi:hypothetical protein
LLLKHQRLSGGPLLFNGYYIEAVRQHTDAIVRICTGDPTAGPIAHLSQSERFHWLTSPRSTIIQTSRVHTGICHDTETLLDRLYSQMIG